MRSMPSHMCSKGYGSHAVPSHLSKCCCWGGRYKFGGPTQTQMVTYNVPTAPGRSRIFFSLIMAKDKAPKMLQRIVPLIPRWLRFLGHFEQHAVLDGDNVFLHRQASIPVRLPVMIPSNEFLFGSFGHNFQHWAGP